MKSSEIEAYIHTLIEDEEKFKNSSFITGQEKRPVGERFYIRLFKFINLLLYSSIDLLRLLFAIKFFKEKIENKKIVYTTRNFCNVVNGELVDRVVKPLFTENIVFINHSKEYLLKRINNQKVYNIGGVVKLLSVFLRSGYKTNNMFRAHRFVNDLILRNLSNQEVYMLWFYNLNGLSLTFSPYRKNITLIEVQHGSMINYPPYVKPAPVKIADKFFVKNRATIDYLRTHLCRDFQADAYCLIPYPKVARQFVPGIHLFYASTVEFNGLHPVLINFLEENHSFGFDLTIRLHPRERDKEPLFCDQLEKYGISFKFDHSENWLEGNTIENLIVISPWSSSIEDSYDNGFVTIIIDPVGKDRYRHLIDNQRCFYTDNLKEALVYGFETNIVSAQ